MEVRIAEDVVEIDGYVNATGRESAPLRDALGYFVEVVEPGAFARALEAGSVPMLLNHDASRVLAQGDTLELREDAIGLHAHAVVRDAEIAAKAAAGRLRGWSFGFTRPQERVEERDGLRHRTLLGFTLNEVSLLDDTRRPAYPATSVYTRDGSDEPELRYMDDECHVIGGPPDIEPGAPDLSLWEERVRALGVIEQ
mgnify:CR=1 FL=1